MEAAVEDEGDTEEQGKEHRRDTSPKFPPKTDRRFDFSAFLGEVIN